MLPLVWPVRLTRLGVSTRVGHNDILLLHRLDLAEASLVEGMQLLLRATVVERAFVHYDGVRALLNKLGVCCDC